MTDLVAVALVEAADRVGELDRLRVLALEVLVEVRVRRFRVRERAFVAFELEVGASARLDQPEGRTVTPEAAHKLGLAIG